MIKVIIEEEKMPKQVIYGDLREGDTFEHIGGLFIKTDHPGLGGLIAAVSLETGYRHSISGDTKVMPVEIEAKVVSRG